MKVQRWSLSVGSVLALSCLLLPRLVSAGSPGNGEQVAVPTLGGVGLGVMAGVLAIAGAWVMARKREK